MVNRGMLLSSFVPLYMPLFQLTIFCDKHLMELFHSTQHNDLTSFESPNLLEGKSLPNLNVDRMLA